MTLIIYVTDSFEMQISATAPDEYNKFIQLYLDFKASTSNLYKLEHHSSVPIRVEIH